MLIPNKIYLKIIFVYLFRLISTYTKNWLYAYFHLDFKNILISYRVFFFSISYYKFYAQSWTMFLRVSRKFFIFSNVWNIKLFYNLGFTFDNLVFSYKIKHFDLLSCNFAQTIFSCTKTADIFKYANCSAAKTFQIFMETLFQFILQ